MVPSPHQEAGAVSPSLSTKTVEYLVGTSIHKPRVLRRVVLPDIEFLDIDGMVEIWFGDTYVYI